MDGGLYGVKREMAVRCFGCDRGNNGVLERSNGDG